MNFPPELARQLVPFPGDPFTLKLKKPEALEKALGVKVPAIPDLATEAERAHELRVNRRYNEKGSWDRSPVGAMLLDLWVQRGGLAFATGALIKACNRRLPRHNPPGEQPFDLRRDGQPWRRLREHLVASKDAKAVDAAHAEAARFWKLKPVDGFQEQTFRDLRCGLAFAFCDAAWVSEMIDPMFEEGYGCWCALAAVRDPKQARKLLERMVKEDLRFQLYEEAVVFLPTLVKTAGSAARPALEAMIEGAFNNKVKKPFLALLDCC